MTVTRMTKQRQAIMSALEGVNEFRSAQAWHEQLRTEGSKVGLATVYRTLQSLAESGDIDSVAGEGGEALFRRCGSPGTHHHHLRCRSCGTAEEIEGAGVEEWTQKIALSSGYSQIDHTIELTGICSACAAR